MHSYENAIIPGLTKSDLVDLIRYRVVVTINNALYSIDVHLGVKFTNGRLSFLYFIFYFHFHFVLFSYFSIFRT